MVEKIRDAAAQKGTGKWAVIEALNSGVPATVIVESVCARFASALKDERVKACKVLRGPERRCLTKGGKEAFVEDLEKVRGFKKDSFARCWMLLNAGSLRVQDSAVFSRFRIASREFATFVWLSTEQRRSCANMERRLCHPEVKRCSQQPFVSKCFTFFSVFS